MATNADTLVKRVRTFVRDYPDWDVTTGALTAAATSMTVADTSVIYNASRQLLEVEGELMQVTGITNATTLAVRRGVRGTIAATHPSGATILVNPRFTSQDIMAGLNAGIDACWPMIYVPVIDESITTAASTYEYAIPGYLSEQLVPNPDGSDGTTAGWTPVQSGVGGGPDTFGADPTLTTIHGFHIVDAAQPVGTISTGATSDYFPVSAGAFTATVDYYVGAPATFTFLAYLTLYGADRVSGVATKTIVSVAGTAAAGFRQFALTGTISGTAADYDGSNLFGGGTYGSIVTAAEVPTWGKLNVFINTTSSAAQDWYYGNATFTQKNANYPLPYIEKIELKEPGDVIFRRVDQWKPIRSSAPKIKFMYEPPPTSLVRITGVGPVGHLLSNRSQLPATFPYQAEDALIQFAGSYLTLSGEIARVRVDTGMIDNREQANRVGASAQVSNALYQRFYQRLAAVAMPPPGKHLRHVLG